MPNRHICFELFHSFVADPPFAASFKNIKGGQVEGMISCASVCTVVFPVKELTGEPLYSIVRTGDAVESSAEEYAGYFNASVNAEFGSVVIPIPEKLAEYKNSHPGQALACRIVEYTIDTDTGEGVLTPNFVKEEEFRRIVTENFRHFNNANNGKGQFDSYGRYDVSRWEKRHWATSF